MSRRMLIKLSISLLIISFFICINGSAFAQTYTIKVATDREPDSSAGRALYSFASHVNDRTDGDVKVEIYPSSQLGSGFETLMTLSKYGTIQMVVMGTARELEPEHAVIYGPFLFETREEAETILRGPTMQKVYDKLIKDHNVRPLDIWYFGFRHITSNKEIHSIEDLKGITIRVPDSRGYVLTMKALEMLPVTIDFAEVYTALQMGVADAEENPLTAIWDKKFYEVQKFIILTGHMLTMDTIVINNDFWMSLPEKYQKIIQEEIIAAGEYDLRITLQREEELISKFEAAGIKIIEIDREPLRKATEIVYEQLRDEWSGGLGLYEGIKKELEELRIK